ncbi:sensor histidine kinase [Myceligenerans crystallogenes]|uniref:Oxygen sensor histidine kinase NreB n=1 Tax=Myceligenerans crystallogenes TaxID=316335 RepID=A0ABP4ZWJ4_9MICO
MTVDQQHDDAPPAPGGPYAGWARVVIWWHLAFWTVLGLTAAQIVLVGVRGLDLAVAYGALAAMGLAYLVWGHRAASGRDQTKAYLYLAVCVIAIGIALTRTGDASFLLFVLFAQCWMLLDRQSASIVTSVILAGSVAAGTFTRVGVSRETLLVIPAQLAVVLVFAVGLGIFMGWTMRRGEEHARLVAELRTAQDALATFHHTAGVEAERARIAREIHDTLAQGFMSVVTQTQAASVALGRDDLEVVGERLWLIEDTARDNLAEARALVAAFAPAPLQGSSLGEALTRAVRRFGAETDIEGVLTVDGALMLPPSAEVVLLRVAQEALANVRRHADASQVDVRLVATAHTVRLEVSDDGRGLPADFGPGSEGFGLAGMRERVTSAGGHLSIASRDGGGTTLAASLPLADGHGTPAGAPGPGTPAGPRALADTGMHGTSAGAGGYALGPPADPGADGDPPGPSTRADTKETG